MIVLKESKRYKVKQLSLAEQRKLEFNRRKWFLKRKYNSLSSDIFNVWQHNVVSRHNMSRRVCTLINMSRN